jgi:hypothetical protein
VAYHCGQQVDVLDVEAVEQGLGQEDHALLARLFRFGGVVIGQGLVDKDHRPARRHLPFLDLVQRKGVSTEGVEAIALRLACT